MALGSAAPLLHVVNDRGVVFNVRVVLEGEPYGLDDVLTHDSSDPLVEFFDTRYPEKFGNLGQFVSRYYLSTLAERAHPDGLRLYGNEADWTLNGANVEAAIAFARQRLTP